MTDHIRQFEKIGIIAKPHEPHQHVMRLINWLRERGKIIYLERRIVSSWMQGPHDLPLFDDHNVPHLDLAVVLGGDGTLIGAARTLDPQGVPLFAVNQGKLGFLTDTTLDEMMPGLEKIFGGEYIIEDRSKLRVEVVRQGEIIATHDVLNDAVINKAALARMLTMQTTVDGHFLTNYRADGLIISTPTGSTAYSLSAGGPILLPSMGATVLAPICPHTLTARPLVLPQNSTIEITIVTLNEDVYLTLDGQVGIELYYFDTLRITYSPVKTHLIRSTKTDFFHVLRDKLSWGET